MKMNDLCNFINYYSGIAILTDNESNIVHYNNNIFDYLPYKISLKNKNLYKIFIENSIKRGALAYAQVLYCQEFDRRCWLNQEIIINTEYYERELFTTIRFIVHLDKDYLLLLINKVNNK